MYSIETAIIFIKPLTNSVFVMEKQYVFFEVTSQFLHVIYIISMV